MTDLNNELVRDLARLAGKYSVDDWDTLLSYVRDTQRLENLTTLLEELANASRLPRQSRTSSARREQPQGVRRSLNELRTQDPDRASLLENLLRGLQTRDVLPEAASLRAFAEVVGLKELRTSKREQAVNQLMRHLMSLDSEVLQDAIRQVAVADRQLGAEYERWVQLILHEGRATDG